jgi:hypothetical protein
MPIVRRRLDKHLPAQANAGNNRASIARQRTSQHASLTEQALFSAWSIQSGYEEVFCSIEQNRSSRVEFLDTSLTGYELGSRGIELSLRNCQLQNKC